MNLRLVAFDSETWRGQPGNACPRLVVSSWATPEGMAWLEDPDGTCARIRQALEDPSVILTNHQIEYDLRVAIEHDPSLLELVFAAYRAGRIRCTLIRGRLLNIAVGSLRDDGHNDDSLAGEVKARLGKDIAETKKGPDAYRLNYDKLDGLPHDQWPQEAVNYVLDDSGLALQLHAAQSIAAQQIGCVDAQGNIADEVPKVYQAFALSLAHQWGVRTDPSRVDRLEADLRERVGDVLEQLEAAGLAKPGGGIKQKELQAAVAQAFEARRLPVPRGAVTEKMKEKAAKKGETPVGNVKYDAQTLIESGDPLLRTYGARAKSVHHINITIPKIRAGAVHPINPRYTVPVSSGRCSSSSPNIQNLPRKGGYRECFVPRPGHVFVGADYSQLELCTLAQIWYDLFGRSSMGEMIKAGLDLHLKLAEKFLGIPYEQLSKATHKKERDFCKEGNYGNPVGMGNDTFLERMYKAIAAGNLSEDLLTYSLEDVARLKSAWKLLYPEHRQYFAYIDRLVKLGRPVQQFKSGRWRGDLTFTGIGNSFFQGLAADGALHAFVRVTEECYLDKSSALYGSRPWAFIHDEIQLETPEDMAHDAAMRLSRAMEEAMEEFTPNVPIEAEPVVARRWSKGAEQVWARGGKKPADSNDRLIPWEAA